MSDDLLGLKWGTIKEVRYPSERVRLALERYYAAGPRSMSAALQEDSAAQKAALRDLIEPRSAARGRGDDGQMTWTGDIRWIAADQSWALCEDNFWWLA